MNCYFTYQKLSKLSKTCFTTTKQTALVSFNLTHRVYHRLHGGPLFFCATLYYTKKVVGFVVLWTHCTWMSSTLPNVLTAVVIAATANDVKCTVWISRWRPELYHLSLLLLLLLLLLGSRAITAASVILKDGRRSASRRSGRFFVNARRRRRRRRPSLAVCRHLAGRHYHRDIDVVGADRNTSRLTRDLLWIEFLASRYRPDMTRSADVILTTRHRG